MAISNEFNWLVVTQEIKVKWQWATALYGDMCGGFALIKDVPKTTVFDLCRWRNEQSEVILQKLLTVPPLPSYDQIKRIPTHSSLPSTRPHT